MLFDELEGGPCWPALFSLPRARCGPGPSILAGEADQLGVAEICTASVPPDRRAARSRSRPPLAVEDGP